MIVTILISIILAQTFVLIQLSKARNSYKEDVKMDAVLINELREEIRGRDKLLRKSSTEIDRLNEEVYTLRKRMISAYHRGR